MATKARELRVRKAKARAKGRNFLPSQKMPPRRSQQRLRLMGLIPRLRMFLLLSQAKMKTLLLELSHQVFFFVIPFVMGVYLFLFFIFYF